MRTLIKARWFLLAVLFLVALAPMSAAAVTNPEIIDILKEGIKGVKDLVAMAYCAAGVTVLC